MSWADEVLCAGLPPGIRWPYRRTCGFLAVHAMSVAQSLYRHTTLSFDGCFLSYLAESSDASRFIHSKGVHGVSLSTVSVVFDCTCSTLLVLNRSDIWIYCASIAAVAR